LPQIVAVDLQAMAPIRGVTQLQGDITRRETAEEIIRHFDGGKADIVVCDGAPDVTGLHALDEYVQHQLLISALNITTFVLKPGGAFVAKMFRGRDVELMYLQFQVFFKEVVVAKPRSSRGSSCEAFIVCRNYSPPEGYEPTMVNLMMAPNYRESRDQLTGINRCIVPFVACGDLSGFDSDRNYSTVLPSTMKSTRADDRPECYMDESSQSAASSDTYQSLPPTQAPITPVYELICGIRKRGELMRPVCETAALEFVRPSTTRKGKNVCEQEPVYGLDGSDISDDLQGCCLYD